MRMFKIIKVLAIVLVFSLLLPIIAEAAVKIPTSRSISLYSIEGNDKGVNIKRGTKKTFTGSTGTSLGAGDTITTDSETVCYLAIDNDKTVKLDTNTVVTISKASAKKLRITLSSGNIYFDVKNTLEKDSELDFKSGGTTMGVRGTNGVFGISDGKVQAAIFTGNVEIVTPSNEKISISEGQYQVINVNGVAEGKPSPIELDKMNSFALDTLINEIQKSPVDEKEKERQDKMKEALNISKSEDIEKLKEVLNLIKEKEEKIKIEKTKEFEKNKNDLNSETSKNNHITGGGGVSNSGDADDDSSQKPTNPTLAEVKSLKELNNALSNPKILKITIPRNASIVSDSHIVIESEKTLIIKDGGSLTSMDGITIKGNLENSGTILAGRNPIMPSGSIIIHKDSEKIIVENNGEIKGIIVDMGKKSQVINNGFIEGICVEGEELKITNRRKVGNIFSIIEGSMFKFTSVGEVENSDSFVDISGNPLPLISKDTDYSWTGMDWENKTKTDEVTVTTERGLTSALNFEHDCVITIPENTKIKLDTNLTIGSGKKVIIEKFAELMVTREVVLKGELYNCGIISPNYHLAVLTNPIVSIKVPKEMGISSIITNSGNINMCIINEGNNTEITNNGIIKCIENIGTDANIDNRETVEEMIITAELSEIKNSGTIGKINGKSNSSRLKFVSVGNITDISNFINGDNSEASEVKENVIYEWIGESWKDTEECSSVEVTNINDLKKALNFLIECEITIPNDTSITSDTPITIGANKTIIIESKGELIVPDGITLEGKLFNSGIITNSNTIYNDEPSETPSTIFVDEMTVDVSITNSGHFVGGILNKGTDTKIINSGNMDFIQNNGTNLLITNNGDLGIIDSTTVGSTLKFISVGNISSSNSFVNIGGENVEATTDLEYSWNGTAWEGIEESYEINVSTLKALNTALGFKEPCTIFIGADLKISNSESDITTYAPIIFDSENGAKEKHKIIVSSGFELILKDIDRTNGNIALWVPITIEEGATLTVEGFSKVEAMKGLNNSGRIELSYADTMLIHSFDEGGSKIENNGTINGPGTVVLTGGSGLPFVNSGIIPTLKIESESESHIVMSIDNSEGAIVQIIGSDNERIVFSGVGEIENIDNFYDSNDLQCTDISQIQTATTYIWDSGFWKPYK